MNELPGWIQPAPPGSLHAAETAAREETHRLAVRAAASVESAASALAAMKTPEGYWCGTLSADATLECDYVLLELWLHPADGPVWNPPARRRIDKALRAVLERQLPDGGWNIYAGGPSEVNATVRAYTVLKIAGHDIDAPYMQAARERALALGGLRACNSYTKINFSLFGLYPRRSVPSVPPEIMLVPGNLIYEMSSWTRQIVVPLSVLQATGIVRPTPGGMTVAELVLPGKRFSLFRRDWTATLFHHLDRLVKLWEKRGVKDIRRAAVREAEHWMLDRTRYTEGLGAIYPAMMYFIMALDAIGYPDDHPDLVEAIRQFEDLMMEDGERLTFQPCVSPVWDTAIATFALGEAGLGDPREMQRTADWLLEKEVRRRGDWSVKRPDLEPGGWAFEFANEYYPDIDDTAMVLLSLEHARSSDPARQSRAEKRAVEWLLGMQSADGGWAAFDVDNNWAVLNRVPFADHNAMLDPSCPDITGRVLEALSRRGFDSDHDAIQNGVRYLLENQEKNGSWYGRWGVAYIYGTFLAMRGLRATGDRAAHPAIEKAARWLCSVQHSDGGWGESCASYRGGRFADGPSCASQTAWALLGLAASGAAGSVNARRGVDYLISTQRSDGTWAESETTGTGFPTVFYLTYHMYRQYFPLLALAAYSRAARG
jgi:squalene-hopene/tetraprenyl-beta-curcumene cyclase